MNGTPSTLLPPDDNLDLTGPHLLRLVREAPVLELGVEKHRPSLMRHHQALSGQKPVQRLEDSEHRERRLEAPDVNPQSLVYRVSPAFAETLTPCARD